MLEIKIHKIRKLLLLVIFAAACLSISASKTHCQQTGNSTPPQSDESRRKELLEALERAQDEVKTARPYIKSLEASVKSKQAIIDAQSKKQTLSDEAIRSLQKEVIDTQAIIDQQKVSIEIGKKEINYLKGELIKTNRKLKRARKIEQGLIVTAFVLFLTTIFK